MPAGLDSDAIWQGILHQVGRHSDGGGKTCQFQIGIRCQLGIGIECQIEMEWGANLDRILHSYEHPLHKSLRAAKLATLITGSRISYEHPLH